MSFQEALESLSRDDRFKATVYAMNSLLIQRGIYTRTEFETLFTEWAERQREDKHGSATTPSLTANP